MADHQSGAETIKQMLAGFNTMQMQLGLLPTRSEQTPLGVGFQPPPPPPQIPHPSQAAIAAVAQQQAAMQQTMQAAQMTRYIPPPSTPIGGGGGSMGGGGGFMPPYMAGALGGGMGSMPNPMTMTAPAFGNYRTAGNFGGPHIGQGHLPPIFNPFVPSVQSSHFMTPAMQSLQIMQGVQARNTGIAAGIVGAGARFAGAGFGAIAGTALGGPVGGLAGGFLGHSLGGALGNMMTGSVTMDVARGQQIQNMSAPWMVSGSILNPFTGQGMDRESGRATATGLRHLATRDHDFRRTGFNTEDVMRITQLSSDQGLLTTARSSDDITRKVKEISKAVKTLIQITGDPDVRNAIASLGQMKDLGFIGTGGQAGAVANRTMYARMAGVSQSAMHTNYGMPGAMMAQQAGLVGATGYTAGMSGAALANIARSSGSLDTLQMARAGGVQGLSQISAMAQLSSANQDIYMGAALKKGSKGIEIDIDAYRRAQTMTISEVSKLAADNLRDMGKEGIFALSTRKQEFKDQLVQQMSPFELGLNVVKQARGMQKSVPGMTLGAAIRSTAQSNAVGAGMGAEQAESYARSQELMYTSTKYYDGQIQGLEAQRRQLVGTERAKRDQFRTPGVATRIGRRIEEGFNDLGDTLSSPYRRLTNRLDRVNEEETSMRNGERIFRTAGSSLVENQRDRALVGEALKHAAFSGGSGTGGGQFESDMFNPRTGLAGKLGPAGFVLGAGGMAMGSDRMQNRFASYIGISKTSDANRINEIAHATDSHAFGHSIGESFGNSQASYRKVQDAAGVARAQDRAGGQTEAQYLDTRSALRATVKGKDIEKIIYDAGTKLHSRAPTAGRDFFGIDSAGAMKQTQVRGAVIDALAASGVDRKEAIKIYESNSGNWDTAVVGSVSKWGSNKVKETLAKSQDAKDALGGLMGGESSAQIKALIKETGVQAGLSGVGEKQLVALKKLASHTDPEVLKLAALRSGGGSKRATKAMDEWMDATKDMDPVKKSLLMKKADALAESADPEAQKALRAIVAAGSGKEAGSLAEISKRFGTVDAHFGVKMAAAAQSFAIEEISSVTGQKGYGSDFNKAIQSMSPEDIENARFTPAQRAMLKRAKKNEGEGEDAMKAKLEFAQSMAPNAEKKLLNDAAGGSLKAIDDQIAETKQLRDEIAAEGGDKATRLFADGSMMLVEAAKDLKEVSENMKIAANSPWYQGLLGGR